MGRTSQPPSPEEAAAAALEVLPAVPAPRPDSPGAHLPDDLVDVLERAFYRLRRSIMRPPAGLVPVPALGRQLDIATIYACDAVRELSTTLGTVTVKDVAAFLDLEHSTVSRLLGEIEDEGLIVRGTDPADRRRTTVELTELGRAVIDDATAIRRFFARLLLGDWSLEDVEALTRLMTRLADTMHSGLDALPETALEEFRRTEAAEAHTAGHDSAADVLTPPSARRR